MITFTIAIDRPKVEKKTVTSRNIKQLDHEELSNDLKAIAIEHSPNDTSTSLVEKYNVTLEKLQEKHAPLRARTITDQTSAPWINADVKLQKQQRRQAERAWRKEKTTVKRQIYQYHHKRVKKTINNAKRDYYRSKMLSCSTSKALFRLTSTLGGRSKPTPLPDQITDDKLPDSFCAYFHDKVKKLRTELDSKGGEPSYEPFSGEPWEQFQTVNPKIVKKVILSSNPKSCVLDPIPSDLLEQHIDDLIGILTNIINASLREGVVPSALKTAAIIPLIKKADLAPNILKNFRPVSNLPFISKILEKIVLEQLKLHLEKNNLIEPFQSAYKAGHCTETALLRITNDLSAAFDTLDHEIMLKRLSLSFGLS
ncbi:RNA-directed DNA polymerase from mobile element jockey, partial [Elysia marginata]